MINMYNCTNKILSIQYLKFSIFFAIMNTKEKTLTKKTLIQECLLLCLK